jgi:hypothetical protein
LNVLNARLYRTCWLVAGVALVVALLTLESPDRGPTPAMPASLDGASTLELTEYLGGVAPSRPAGSEADLSAARVVQNQFAQLPGMGGKVQTQEFEVRAGGRRVALQNVYLAVPGESGGGTRGGVLVVAPRDTPPGVQAGVSSTAIMLRLARQSVTTRHLRPHLFVSTDGNTLGQSGMRWFLHTFSSFPISSVIVLDGLGDAEGDRVHVWSRGMNNSQSLELARLAAESITRAGGRPEAVPGLANQLLRLAVPQTFGDQGAVVAEDIPSVTLSGRSDSPLHDGPAPTEARLQLTANAAADLLAVLDQPDVVASPDTGIALAGRVVRPTVGRLALLLLMLPVLVLAVDALARGRREGASLRAGMRATRARMIPGLVALFAAHLLVLFGVWPATAAGAPPQPGDVPLSWAGALGVVVVAGVFLLAWRGALRGARRPVPGEGPAALLVLSVLLVLLWLLSPFALLLVLPAAHAMLLASAAERVWQVRTLIGVGLLPLLILAVSIAGTLDSNPLSATWYLIETAAAGARGATGPLLGLLIAGALWSLAAFATDRAREIADPGGAARRRRPRVRLQIERVPVGRRRRTRR